METKTSLVESYPLPNIPGHGKPEYRHTAPHLHVYFSLPIGDEWDGPDADKKVKRALKEGALLEQICDLLDSAHEARAKREPGVRKYVLASTRGWAVWGPHPDDENRQIQLLASTRNLRKVLAFAVELLSKERASQ